VFEEQSCRRAASSIIQSTLALAEAPLNTRGGTWNAEGTIVFTRSTTEPLFRVPASRGKPVAITEVKAPDLGHRYPHFLPDGRHFLYFAGGPPESQGVQRGLAGLETDDEAGRCRVCTDICAAGPRAVRATRRGPRATCEPQDPADDRGSVAGGSAGGNSVGNCGERRSVRVGGRSSGLPG
jgi:hypothetical protein